MADTGRAAEQFLRLVQIVADLRSEHGCPWDREQTHATLKSCLIEETYEVCEAIDRASPQDLREELGDLLMQSVMHAQLAEEAGRFEIADVLQSICDKLVRRHPHVYGDVVATTPVEVLRRWELLKQQEKGGEQARSLMDGIPTALPALLRAHKIQDKFARVGFDWPDEEGALDKVKEEYAEVLQARRNRDLAAVEEEIGDLLFATVNAARLLQVDAEQALRRACDKAAARFRKIEETARAQGRDVREMTLEEMDAIWNASK